MSDFFDQRTQRGNNRTDYEYPTVRISLII